MYHIQYWNFNFISKDMFQKKFATAHHRVASFNLTHSEVFAKFAVTNNMPWFYLCG